MNERPNNYNLLVEPWIPVLWSNGKYGRVGIKDALTQARRIRQIAASNPMDRVAILRFLLALLYWCKGNPPHRANATPGDSFPADWFSRLDDHEECFNLLGDGKRFYQYRKSGSGRDTELTANYLVQEVPTGTNQWHFRHSTDRTNGLCPACCAMGLLRLPLFATSGGRGKPPGVNSKPPIYVIPVGSSLAETLRLSWQQVSDLGTPAWEKPDLQLPKTGPVPLLMGLTWLPRRVWLGNPDGPRATCISCGRTEHLIRLSVFAPIGSAKADEGGPGRLWRDPHVLYVTSPKGEATPLRAGNALDASDAAAGQWARIMAGVLRQQEAPDASPRASSRSLVTKSNTWVVGFSTVQNDKYLEAMECLMPSDCPPSQLQGSIEKIERWRQEGGRLAKRIARAKVEGATTIAAIRPHVESRVSERAAELMAGGEASWEQASGEYRRMMAAIAKSLSPGITTAAVERRLRIAAVTPDMRPKTGADENPGREKGEAK